MSYPPIDWNQIEAIEQSHGQHVVAIIYNQDGSVYDHAFTWETGQSMALNEGYRVRAIKRDGHMSVSKAQRLYDAEYARRKDCFA
jgi:hypothetical protein